MKAAAEKAITTALGGRTKEEIEKALKEATDSEVIDKLKKALATIKSAEGRIVTFDVNTG